MKTEIKTVVINWMQRWANDPLICVSMGSKAVLFSQPFDKRGALHRADFSNGEVQYFHSDGEPTSGFGGLTFAGKLKDGTPFKYRGAWSSRSSCINAAWPESPIVDVMINDNRSGAILVDTLVEWYLENKPEWGLAVCDIGDMGPIIVVVYPNGEFKKSIYRSTCLALLNRDGSNRAEFMNAFKKGLQQ